jgi:hypothetical protein
MTSILGTIPISTSSLHIIALNGDDEENITATDMIINPLDCDEPCNSVVTVTWKNIGKKSATFRPAIKVNGIKIELVTEITLTKNHTTIQTFNLTNLMEGTYTICPYPN